MRVWSLGILRLCERKHEVQVFMYWSVDTCSQVMNIHWVTSNDSVYLREKCMTFTLKTLTAALLSGNWRQNGLPAWPVHRSALAATPVAVNLQEPAICRELHFRSVMPEDDSLPTPSSHVFAFWDHQSSPSLTTFPCMKRQAATFQQNKLLSVTITNSNKTPMWWNSRNFSYEVQMLPVKKI